MNELATLIASITGVLGILGGGTIMQLVNLRHTRRQDDAKQAVSEDDALAKRWEAIVRTQTEALIEPLQKQITDLGQKVEHLESQLDAARREASAERSKYWKAIGYARTLRALIDRFLDPTSVTVPEAPADIIKDI